MMVYGTIAGVGKPVSRLILGTMIISDREASPPGTEYPYLNMEDSFALLDAVLANGGNAFDTAHVYGAGHSESGLGKWMRGRHNREEVVIVTKGGVRGAEYKVTPGFIDADVYESLQRLQTDYIDIYILHRDEPKLPAGTLVQALHAHWEAGRIRAYGGSNWTHQRIAEANEYAQKHGLQPFVVSQPNYGLAEQVENPWGPGCVTLTGMVNREARAWYGANQMPVLSYSSLARGFFSGRITRDNFEEVRATLDSACLKAYCHECNFQRLDRAMELAEKKGVTVPQLALAFILTSPMNVFPLVGAASEAEFRENLGAFDIELTQKERAWLDLQSDREVISLHNPVVDEIAKE